MVPIGSLDMFKSSPRTRSPIIATIRSKTQQQTLLNMKPPCCLNAKVELSIPVTTVPIDVSRIALYHCQTLILFTCDQIIDTFIPGTTFGIIAAISGPDLDLPTQDISAVLRRIPLVVVWLWVLVFQFCLQNQCSPRSVEEDSLNKPWRPIPSGRISRTEVEYLLAATQILAVILSYCLDVLPVYVLYIILITRYNDFGGGDHSGILRNLFCGADISCYFAGAMRIALGPDTSMSSQAWKWVFLVTFGILTTTIQTQDFRDEVGDKARGRQTLVTELGREHALWTVILMVLFWSLYTTVFFFTGD